MSQEPHSVEKRRLGDRLRDDIAANIRMYHRFDFLAKVSVGYLGFALFVAVLAPVLAPFEPQTQHYEALLAGPLEVNRFLLGTDIFGRDVLSRLMYGARVSLLVAFGAVAFAMITGCTAGSVAGWSGGKVDETIMRGADMIFAFPSLVLALALIAVTGPSIRNLILVIGIVYTPQYARLIRSSILSVKEEPYIEAARSTGLSSRRVLIRHAIPNAMTPVIVQASFHMAWAMLLEASLSFLGLGVQPPTASWGIMIANGRSEMPVAWWLMTFPGIAIMMTVLSFNFIGDALQSEFDPHEITEETKEAA